MSLLLTFVLAAAAGSAAGNVYDCWDPEKLQRMKFKFSKEEGSDPGLAQFSKMVKCLSQQQGGRGALNGPEWTQFNNMPGMQFVPNWNYNNQNKQQPYPGGPGGNNPYGGNNNNKMWGRQQPRPGVDPADWGRSGGAGPGAMAPGPSGPQLPPSQPGPGWPGNQQPGMMNNNLRPGQYGTAVTPTVWGKNKERERNRGEGEDRDGTGRKRNRNRKNRNRNKDNENDNDNSNMDLMGAGGGNNMRMDNNMPGGLQQQPLPGVGLGGVGDGTRSTGNLWGGGTDPIDQPPLMADNVNMEDSAAVSLSRKYGYAIMALSVVVLAVLMIATIFCCNSSNSTMSQAATQNLPVNQYDTYSIYSYSKAGGVGTLNHPSADTMRSTGTLGGLSLHTETLKSTRSGVGSRASPQYRVSDIDPDFARRFKDNQHQY